MLHKLRIKNRMKIFLLPLTKYGSSRFVFRFFGSLECSRRSRTACPEPRSARRGLKLVRAIFKIHRQKGIRKQELSASLRSAANLYGIFGEKDTDLSIRAKEKNSCDFNYTNI
jgi:hypothetical protein